MATAALFVDVYCLRCSLANPTGGLIRRLGVCHLTIWLGRVGDVDWESAERLTIAFVTKYHNN